MASIFKSPFLSIAGQKERLLNVVGTVNAAFNPFSKATVTANVSNPTMKTALETVSNHPYISAGIIAGGVTAITNPTAAAALAKSAIPTTPKGKVIAAVGTPVVLGAFIREPVAFTSAAIKLPGSLANVGGNLAGLIVNPSVAGFKELVEDNPVIVGAGAAAAALLLAKSAAAAAAALASARQTAAIKEQTEAMLLLAAGGGTTTPPPSTVLPPPSPIPKAPPVPVTPQTETVMAGTAKRRKRKLRIKPSGNISQRVNVLVANRNTATAKRYISKEVLAY